MKKWEVISTKEIFSAGVLKIKSEECRLPDGKIMPRYFVVDFTDWVHVIPITKEKEILVVNQYRHAARDCFIEFPGGSMDPNSKENPEEAAQRELLEETGYVPARVEYIGKHMPNPALQTNYVHLFLGIDCEKKGEQKLDPFERLTVETYNLADLKALLTKGGQVHSLMLASLAMALPSIEQNLL